MGQKEPQKTRYEHLSFIKLNPLDTIFKGLVWECRDNRTRAPQGIITFVGKRQRYCFMPSLYCAFDSESLTDVIDFIGQLKGD